MHGGFPRGHLFLIRGPSGAGKTTLSLQFLIAGAQRGESVLYVGTSESTAEIRRIADSHGWSLEGVRLHHHDITEAGDEQTMLHPAEVELPRVMDSILQLVDELSPSRLVIDSLAEIRMLARDELWYRRQLLLLKQRFMDSGSTVLLVEIRDPVETLNTIVSGVIEMEHPAPTFGPDHRRLRIVKIRGRDYASGHHDYKIKKGGIEVYPRLVAADHRDEVEWQSVPSGIENLDEALEGGFVRGNSVLLLGPSGTGKSVVASQVICAAAERGVRCAMYIFDERVNTLLTRAKGMNLPLREQVESGQVDLRQIDPTELTAGEFSHLVMKSVQDEGIELVVLDSLNGYAYSMPDERLLSLHLHELTSYLNQQGVTSVFTMTEHGFGTGPASPGFEVSYVADTVVVFRFIDHEGGFEKAVSIHKHRSGPHDTKIRKLKISEDGVSLEEPILDYQGVASGSPASLGGNSVDNESGSTDNG